MTIPVPQRINNKLTEEFYPLQREELIKLYEVGLIKSAAYIHFALRLENPFCDRPVQIIPKEFALRWKIPEKSVYRAIARLKELEILNIKSGKLVVEWNKPKREEKREDIAVNENPTSKFSEIRNDSQSCDKILRSEKKFSEVRKNSQSWENRPPETPPDKDSKTPQTLQIYSDFIQTLSEGEREAFLKFVKNKTNNLEKEINDLEAWLASKNAAKQNRWEIYHKLFKDQQQQRQKPTGSRLYKNRTNYSFEEKQAAIARFREELKRNRPEVQDNLTETQSNSPNNPENKRNNPKNE